MNTLARAAAMLCCCLVIGCAARAHGETPAGADDGFVFAALGDTPYTTDEETSFVAMLVETRKFPGAVALIHGDTHRFRIDQPLIDPETQQPAANFTRIEIFGSPVVNWIRVRITENGGRVIFHAEPGS